MQTKKLVDGMPRRNYIDLMTVSERAIRDAVQRVEEAGCDVLLTEAVVLLGQAKDKVADYFDMKALCPNDDCNQNKGHDTPCGILR